MADLRNDLIDAAKYFHDRGWMWGTAGNLSARASDGSYWVTASGKSKGELIFHDFIQMQMDGTWQPTRPDDKPSAETSIHHAIYSLFPDAKACYHVHSVEANLVSNFTSEPEIQLPPLEMIKGLGIWQQNPTCSLPLFENHLSVPKISEEILDRFSITKPDIPALLIRNHGVTVWATSTQNARNSIELIEYIFRYMVLEKQVIAKQIDR
jgi:methylthioribulose-1-phosphate dehydratase